MSPKDLLMRRLGGIHLATTAISSSLSLAIVTWVCIALEGFQMSRPRIIVHNQALLNNPQMVLLPFTVQDQVAMDPSIRSLFKTLQSFLVLGFKGFSEIWIKIFYISCLWAIQASESSSRNF
jgi:hypothetical protein